MTRKLDYNDVKKRFEDVNCILLETEYVNNKTPMKYICSCGNESVICLNNFSKGGRCNKCGTEKTANGTKNKYEDVYKIFKDNGCILLEETYINSYTNMRYMCVCGNISFLSLKLFRKGHRCKKCGDKKRSGENSYCWNGGITNLQNHLRKHITDWKKESLIKCGFKCVVSGLKDDLIVHHLYPFHKIAKETMEVLKINSFKDVGDYTESDLNLIINKFISIHDSYGLGASLNKYIHKEFHARYGRTDFIPDDFEHFKNTFDGF